MQHTEGTFAAFDGTTIFHQAWLPEGDPRGVVLLVHGLGEHSGRYGHVAQALVDHGYAVHALDHRGHGRSSGKRAFVKQYDEFLRDLHRFRTMVQREQPGTPLVVLGHSMGGNIAMGYTLGNQDGIAALVLSGPALKIGDDFSPIQLKLFTAISKVAPGVRPQGLSDEAISRDPAVVEAYRNDPLVYTGKISAGLGAALIGAMQSFPARYAELRLPILVLHGTADQLADVSGSRELEAAAVNADLTAHYYEGWYHEVFNEPEHDRVLADLIAWLDAHV
jgi:alpha-beta hydrolase superfamily lysophospholipase